jgi:hypothetical protein
MQIDYDEGGDATQAIKAKEMRRAEMIVNMCGCLG